MSFYPGDIVQTPKGEIGKIHDLCRIEGVTFYAVEVDKGYVKVGDRIKEVFSNEVYLESQIQALAEDPDFYMPEDVKQKWQWTEGDKE